MSTSTLGYSWSPDELRRQHEEEKRGDPFLVYRDAGGKQQLHPLRDATRVTIGRDSTDVELAADRSVSRLHAELERHGEDWLLVDDGLSRNGSFVNGERAVGRRRLRDGDVVRIGHTQIVFVAPAQRSAESTASHTGAGGVHRLSETQRRVLVALCRPLIHGDRWAAPATNEQIAGEVFLSVDRVKAHLRVLFETFGIQEVPQNQKRLELARRALESGTLSRHDFG